MKWFNNIRITLKLLVAFLLMAVITGSVALGGIKYINQLQKNDEILYNQMTKPLANLANINTAFQSMNAMTRDIIISNTDSQIAYYTEQINSYRDMIKTESETFSKSVTGSQQMQDAYQKFVLSNNYYSPYVDDILKLGKANTAAKDAEAYELFAGDMSRSSQVEQQALNNLIELKLMEGNDRIGVNDKEAKEATATMIAIMVLTMLIAVALGLFFTRMISAIKGMVATANQIADGQLGVHIKVKGNDEIGRLATALRQMAQNLKEVIGNIQISADQVASGSKEVASSSQALSQGATEQASSVEEITASMEQISAQTRQNADHAIEANKIALSAKDDAIKGNGNMQNMLTAMEEINESSANISKIIKVIDDIAFQTNILALNAAVEAARAGQHGRGFSVVAEEVRSLAVKSADAAKETTAMIEGSMKKVEGGTKIANETAASLDKIVTGVTQAADLLGQIAIASNEQSLGLAQISKAISQVSDVVQTNSATSEESAAASEELYGQAQLLKEMTSRFVLEEEIQKEGKASGKKKGKAKKEKKSKKAAQAEPVQPEEKKEAAQAPAPVKETEKKTIHIELGESDYGKYK